MADNDTIRRLRVEGSSTGLDELERKLNALTAAQKSFASGSGEAAIATDTSARKQLSAASAMDRLISRLDESYRAQKRFADSINLVQRAADTGYFAKLENGAVRFQQVLESLKREFEAVSKGSGVGFGISGPDKGQAEASFKVFEDVARAKAESIGQEFTRALNERLVDGAGKSARDSASVFEEALRPIEEMARLKGQQAGEYFGQDLNASLIAGVGKSARDSASVFEEAFRPMEEAARHRAQWIADEFTRELNQRLIAGTGKSARDSASAFEENFAASANAQAAFNQQLGVKPWQPSGSQAGESANAFMQADAEAAKRLTIEYDQLTAAQERRDTAMQRANELLARGAIEEEQHARIVAGVSRVYADTERALARTGVAVDKYASGMGVARHEMINFSRQVQDIGVSLYSGQAFWTVAIQQGTQLFDIFSTSKASPAKFFQEALGGVARFATSLGGVVTGVVGLGVALGAAGQRWAEGQRQIEVSLMGIGRGSGQTVESINRIADAAAKAGSISRSTGREIASAFAGTGQIDKSLIGTNLVDTLSRGYGVLTNKSQTDAGKDLAQALASPTAGAQELEKRIGKLSDAQMEFIRSAEASGNKLEAQRALLNAINEPLSVAANRVGFFAKAWEAVASAASGAADAVGKAVSGPTLDQQIDTLQKSIEARVRRGQNIYGLNVGSSRSVIAREEAELAPLLRQRRARNEAAEFASADAASTNTARQAGPIARGITTDLSRRLGLEEQLSALEKAFGDSSAMKKLGPTADLVSGAIEKLKSSLANFETEAERIQRDYELQTQQINAYTLAERAAVEAERARIEAIRAGRGELQAGVEAEQARTRVIVEANRQLRDTMRDLKDQGSLIGLSPFARQFQENANTSRREHETLTMSGVGAGAGSSRLGSMTRDQVLDLIEQKESAGRNVPNYKFGPGYTAQGFFQITNPTWRDGARTAGVDLQQYPNAMSAPYDVQRKVASSLIDQRGVQPWAPHNPALRNALGMEGVSGAASAESVRNANALKEAYEGWNTPLANANRTLDAQIALQARAQQTFGMTTGEITAAAEKQRLLNEYAAQGIPITSDLAAGIEDYARRAGQAAQATETFANTAKALREIGDASKDALKGFISDIRNGVSGAEAFKNALNRIADKLIDMALNDLFGKAFGNNSSGGLTNLLFGGFGKSFITGGLGTTPGSGGLYADGGWTGPGHKWQPAGVVHRGEVVWSQADVSRAGGVAVVESMRRGLPGYANGGSPGYSGAPAAANSNAPPQVNIYTAPGMVAETKVREDGGLEVYVDQAEGQMARKMARGRGPLAFATKQAMNNMNLRG